MSSIRTLASSSKRLVWPCVALLALAASGCAMLDRLPPFPTAANRLKDEQQKVSLAKLSEERNNAIDARHIYEEVLKKNPQHQECHRRLAIMATKEGKFAEADDHFQKAWTIGPQSTELLCDMSYRLYLEHRLAEAEPLLRQALTRDPMHPTANNNLGLVLGQMNRAEEALQCFRKVNSEAEAHANMGYVLSQIGRNEQAAMHFSQALSNDRNMKSAANGLLALSGNMRQPPTPMPGAPSSPAPDLNSPPTVAGQMPNGGSFPHPGTAPSGGATQITQADPNQGWQPPPPGYYVPPPTPPAQAYTASPTATSGSVQPTAYWSPNQNRSEAAYYQGPSAPYGGQHVGGMVPAELGAAGLPAQYSNGIPPQASSTINMSR